MFTEIVTVKLPDDITRKEVMSIFETTIDMWSSNPDLLRKCYLFDAERGIAGGVYLWREKAHAQKWHGAEFRRRATELYGAEPQIHLFETPIVVDNLIGEIEIA